MAYAVGGSIPKETPLCENWKLPIPRQCVSPSKKKTGSMNSASWKTIYRGNLTTSNAGSFVHTSLISGLPQIA
jgi:hypothetical protein